MAGVVSGGSKLRPEEAKKFFQDQAPPLFQGLDVHPTRNFSIRRWLCQSWGGKALYLAMQIR